VNVRAIREDDLPAIAAFLADDEERLLGRPSRIGVGDVRAWIDPKSFADRSWLFEDAPGRIVALGWAEVHGEVGIAIGAVHRDATGRGLGSQLVDRSESGLREDGVGRIHQIVLAADPGAPELLDARGYREVRRFWEMTIELGDEAPVVPSLPGGMRIETFDERDARPFHDALEEAFRDHWEHVSQPFEEWWNEKRSAQDYSPDLWFLVRDGDEIAAVARNDPNRSGGGWIGALGVRRRWRGRGLARALLVHSFREFHERGKRRVGLGVDAENPTGATRLYESVGMHVELEQVVWEKAVA
jgi:ribosomal protein S18 acetylase RimI-like enzyme